MKFSKFLASLSLVTAAVAANAALPPVTPPLFVNETVGAGAAAFVGSITVTGAGLTTFNTKVFTPGISIVGFDLYNLLDLSLVTPIAGKNSSSNPSGSTKTFTYLNLSAGDYALKVSTSGLSNTLRVISSANVTEYSTSPVPEPETLALALGGVGVAGTLLRRRRSA